MMRFTYALRDYFTVLDRFDHSDNLQLQITQISAFIVFSLACSYVVLALFVPTSPSQWGAILCIVLLAGLAAVQSLRGHQRIAAMIVTLVGWSAVAGAELGLDWAGAYINDASLFVLIIILATVMLGSRAGSIVVVFSTVTTLLDSALRPLPALSYDHDLMMRLEVTHWIERSLLFVATLLFVRMLMNRLMGAIHRSQQSEAALVVRNRQLEAEVIERQHIEAILQQQSEHLQLALKAGRMRTWNWDLRTNIIHGQNMGGTHPLPDGTYSAEELFRRIDPQDYDLVKAQIALSIASEQSCQLDYRVLQPDGSSRWLRVSGGRYTDDHGNVVGLSGVSQDITEQKLAQQKIRRSQERFSKAFHANPIPTAITTPDVSRTYIDVNESWANLFGYAPHELIGQSSLKVDTWVNPDDPERVRSTYEAQGSVRDMEIWRKARDGKKILVHMTIETIEIEDDNHWLVMLRDVTEHKLVSEQALELAMVRERVNVLRDFLSTMSHDLKTPLSVMNTSLDLLERVPDPSRRREKAEVIRAQVSLVNRYIQDTLTIARLDYTPDLTIENVKLPALVEAIHDRLLPRVEEKRQSFTIAIEPTLPELRGDADELERAFLNLIENAINYTPSGGRIAVRAQPEGRMVHVEVQDTGIGIAPKDHALVFERFFRTSAGKQTHQNGTGLGLAIVKRIVEMHGGKIELESTPGEGSVFHLYLPMVSSADDETQPSLTPPHSLPLLDAHADG